MNFYRLLLFPCLLLVLQSCNKDKGHGKTLAALDLSGGYAFVLTTSDSVKGGRLYKLTDADPLIPVKLYNSDGDDLTNDYSVDNIYEINTEFMLLVASLGGQSHSYLMEYYNGTLKEVDNTFRPENYVNGTWQPDNNSKALKNPATDVYYLLGYQQITRLSFVLGPSEFSNISLNGWNESQFDADVQDDILFGNKFIPPYDTAWEVGFDQTNYGEVADYDKGFWVTTIGSSRISFHHLYADNGVLMQDTLSSLLKPQDNVTWVGGYNFPSVGQTLLVYNTGIVKINSSGRRYYPMSALRMGRFDECCASDNYLYITGANEAGQVSFIRINAAQESLGSGDVFAAKLYNVDEFHISHQNTGAFSAVRYKDNVSIFGYFNDTVMKVKENYASLKVKQVLAIK